MQDLCSSNKVGTQFLREVVSGGAVNFSTNPSLQDNLCFEKSAGQLHGKITSDISSIIFCRS